LNLRDDLPDGRLFVERRDDHVYNHADAVPNSGALE
jgi:hypothetical protein